MMKNKALLVSLTVLMIIGIFVMGVVLYKKGQNSEVSAALKEQSQVLSPDDAPKLGPSGAKIQLVEFLDPECESCRNFYPVVKMLMKDYEGKIELTIRYAPFHPNSRFAIKILEAARKQGKYWETLEVLFQHQPEWGSHHSPRPELIWNYLPQVGVDIEKVKTDMNDPAIDTMIEREVKDGQTLNVRSTPQFFVNGKMLETFGVEPLRELIQSEL